jgi:hypothetical protein
MTDVNMTNAATAAQAVRSGRAADAGDTTVRRSAGILNLAVAMAQAQGELKNPPKDSINPHFKSKYADLATVRDAVTPALSKHGLAVIQLPCELGDAPALTTLLTHKSGEWVETTIRLRPGKSDPQGVGSALTYMRRYCLQSVCGVAADDDDDGHAASRPAAAPAKSSAPANSPALRARVAMAIAQADSRDALTAVYQQYDADTKAGKFSADDLAALDDMFREAGKRFPKSAAPAK